MWHSITYLCGEGFSFPDPTNYCRSKKSLVSDICDLRIDELQMLDAFVRVINDLYVFVMVMKLRHEVSNALLNHLSLRVVIEKYCI